MKSTQIVFALALGAPAALLAFQGCSVSTGDPLDASTASDGASGAREAGASDSGMLPADDASAVACTGNMQKAELPAECQSCLDQSCCMELKACFNQSPGTLDGGEMGASCDLYAQCVFNCYDPSGDDAGTPEECVTSICDIVTSPEIQTSFRALVNCGYLLGGCAGPCNIAPP